MKKNITVKIFAFLALFWIVISVVGTWIMIFVWGWNEQVETEEVLNLDDLQKKINEWKFEITESGSITSSWKTEK